MSLRAKVGSLEAVESFRSSLVVYMAQARSALEEISSEVVRTRLWLENDQRANWERELRRRGRTLEEAQAALFSAKISKFSDGVSLEQIAVHKAKRAMEEADAKMRVVKKWARDFEGIVQPQVKQMEKLHTFLSHDLLLAAAELQDIARTIAEYAQLSNPASAGSGSPPASTPAHGAPESGSGPGQAQGGSAP